MDPDHCSLRTTTRAAISSATRSRRAPASRVDSDVTVRAGGALTEAGAVEGWSQQPAVRQPAQASERPPAPVRTWLNSSPTSPGWTLAALRPTRTLPASWGWGRPRPRDLQRPDRSESLVFGWPDPTLRVPRDQPPTAVAAVATRSVARRRSRTDFEEGPPRASGRGIGSHHAIGSTMPTFPSTPWLLMSTTARDPTPAGAGRTSPSTRLPPRSIRARLLRLAEAATPRSARGARPDAPKSS